MRSALLLATEPGDAELMRRIQTDDLEAFALLYDRYAAKTSQLAALICDRPGVAEDAVEAGFFSIWKARAEYVPEQGDVETWKGGSAWGTATAPKLSRHLHVLPPGSRGP